MSIAKLKKIARRFYSETLPYHNFEHVLETIKNARVIMENCKKDSIMPDEDVIYVSLLFHDAGYHENHEQKGYASKEDYAAAIAEKALKGQGLLKDKISKIKR